MSDTASPNVSGSVNNLHEPTAITEFLEKYRRDRNEWAKLSKHVHDICEHWLRAEALISNVTSRAKDEQSLREKLLKQEAEKPGMFNSVSEISSSIVDLAGVRIALYYPSQKHRVDTFLRTTFRIGSVVEHPKDDKERHCGGESQGPGRYQTQFKRYRATHYHARLKGKHLTKRWENDIVEIQVMNILHSAWSEVEHNIIYKQLSGTPSQNEQKMLDCLNGLVTVGEMYMDQFSTAFDERVKNERNKNEPFVNRYQLGSFLFSQLCEIHQLRSEDFTLSSVEILRLFLELDCIKLNTPAELSKRLPDFDFRTNSGPVPLPETKRPNASLVIMWSLYNDEHLEPRAKQSSPQRTEDYCKVMMSTIISLDEMFAPFSCWEPQLTEESAMHGDRKTYLGHLKWLMHEQAPRLILLRKFPPEEEDTKRIHSLWKWFEKHPNQMVRFVFDISRLGVIRDLQHEISLLERIFRMFEPLHNAF